METIDVHVLRVKHINPKSVVFRNTLTGCCYFCSQKNANRILNWQVTNDPAEVYTVISKNTKTGQDSKWIATLSVFG